MGGSTVVCGIAVLDLQFGDRCVDQHSKHMLSSGHWVCREEGTPRQIKTVKLYSGLEGQFFYTGHTIK